MGKREWRLGITALIAATAFVVVPARAHAAGALPAAWCELSATVRSFEPNFAGGSIVCDDGSTGTFDLHAGFYSPTYGQASTTYGGATTELRLKQVYWAPSVMGNNRLFHLEVRSGPLTGAPLVWYAELRQEYVAPYSYYYLAGHGTVLGALPGL